MKRYGSKRLSSLSTMEHTKGRAILEVIVTSNAFEAVSCALIALKVGIMCAEMLYQGLIAGHKPQIKGYTKPGAEIWPYAEDVFAPHHLAFSISSSIELLLRCLARKMQTLKQGWSWLDIVLLTIRWSSVETRRQVHTYFGTLQNGMLTMFEISLGKWIVTCQVLLEEVSEWRSTSSSIGAALCLL